MIPLLLAMMGWGQMGWVNDLTNCPVDSTPNTTAYDDHIYFPIYSVPQPEHHIVFSDQDIKIKFIPAKPDSEQIMLWGIKKVNDLEIAVPFFKWIKTTSLPRLLIEVNGKKYYVELKEEE